MPILQIPTDFDGDISSSNTLSLVLSRLSVGKDNTLTTSGFGYRCFFRFPLTTLPTGAYIEAVDLIVNVLSVGANYPDVIAASPIKGYWRLGETSGNPLDSSANPINGTLFGTYRQAPAQYGGNKSDQHGLLADDGHCLQLDGSSGYVRLANGSTKLNVTGDWSVEAWVFPRTDLPRKSAIYCRQLESNNVEMALGFGLDDDSARPCFGFMNGGVWFLAKASNDIQVDYPQHIVGTWDSVNKNLRVYLNGVLVGGPTNTGTQVPTNGSTGYWQIGRNHDGTGTRPFFKGMIQEVAVYSEALSDTRVAERFRVGTKRLEARSFNLKRYSVQPIICVGSDTNFADQRPHSSGNVSEREFLATVEASLNDVANWIMEPTQLDDTRKTFIFEKPRVYRSPLTETQLYNKYYPPITSASPRWGTITAVGSNTLTDSTKSWNANELVGVGSVDIVSGVAGGTKRNIISNTGDTITVSSPWGSPAPQVGDRYIVGDNMGWWVDGVKEACAAWGLNVCDPTKIWLFITTLNTGMGASVGKEVFGCSTGLVPGSVSFSGHMGRLIGGIIDDYWVDWWALTNMAARGALAHELCHQFGSVWDAFAGSAQMTPHVADPSSDVMSAAFWSWRDPTNPPIFDYPTALSKLSVQHSHFIVRPHEVLVYPVKRAGAQYPPGQQDPTSIPGNERYSSLAGSGEVLPYAVTSFRGPGVHVIPLSGAAAQHIMAAKAAGTSFSIGLSWTREEDGRSFIEAIEHSGTQQAILSITYSLPGDRPSRRKRHRGTLTTAHGQAVSRSMP